MSLTHTWSNTVQITTAFIVLSLALFSWSTMVRDADQVYTTEYIGARLHSSVKDTTRAYNKAARNVRAVLRRQILNTIRPTPDRPVCTFLDEEGFMEALGTIPLEVGLLTVARLYDEAHVTLCKSLAAARKGQTHNEEFRRDRKVDLRILTNEFLEDKSVVNDQILLEMDPTRNNVLNAIWKPVVPMSFDNLPRLESLSDLLPTERSACKEYAGIGGGGGSDIISASLLGRLLRLCGKRMDLLISTRTWATGSQGKAGSKMGVKREVYKHGGQALLENGKPVPGTFRVRTETHAEGRDLEAIPIAHHARIYMVLDQGESASDITESDKADLPDQFQAVLSQAEHKIDTVLTVDTGGDVFGADTTNTTPDQDLRVQAAISTLASSYNLITVVVAPGVDAPASAPQIAARAGGMVYTPSEQEKQMLLHILADEYKMDGSIPSRFGKTTLSLQARLKGKLGWHSMDLPEYVVDTWENPWNSFVYIRECMEDIVLMPTVGLLPLIEVNGA